MRSAALLALARRVRGPPRRRAGPRTRRPARSIGCAHDEVLALPQRHGSAHQLSLPEALGCLAVAFPAMAAVRYRMWGVEPLRAAPPAGMSAPVAAAAAAVADEIRQALAAR